MDRNPSDFQHRLRRTERVFKWVAVVAFIVFVVVLASAIAQWKDYYDVRKLFGL